MERDVMKKYSLLICFLITFTASVTFPSSPDVNSPPISFSQGSRVGTLEAENITEVSGIAASRKNPGILWVHNDSDNSPAIYAITAEGKLVATCRIKEAICRDWEDIAIASDPQKEKSYIYIGDIGDNFARRSSIFIYRVEEPKLDPNSPVKNIEIGPADSIELVYPDSNPMDAETLMVDSLTGDIYIVTKRELLSKVYVVKYPQSLDEKNTMSLVSAIPWGFATGGDISPDSKLIIIRGMYNASLWIRPEAGELSDAFSRQHYRIELIQERQGEAICFDSEGLGYYTTSEGFNPPIHYFPGKEVKNPTSD